MSGPLSATQVASFQRDGFLVVEGVLSEDEVAALAARADLIAAGEADHIPDANVQLEPAFLSGEREIENQVLSVRKLNNIAVHDPVMWEHATNPKIVDIIAALLDTDDLKMYGAQLFMKAPEVGRAKAWHQDSEAWRDILPMDLVSSWTAIDAATLDNGCLHFAPGTHRWGMLNGRQLAPFLSDLDSGRWPSVPVPMRPGSISFHHSLTLHSSGPNQTAERRRGYAVHYMRATSIKDEGVTAAPKTPPFRQVRGNSFPGRV